MNSNEIEWDESTANKKGRHRPSYLGWEEPDGSEGGNKDSDSYLCFTATAHYGSVKHSEGCSGVSGVLTPLTSCSLLTLARRPLAAAR